MLRSDDQMHSRGKIAVVLLILAAAMGSLFTGCRQKSVCPAELKRLIAAMNTIGLQESLKEFDRQPDKQTAARVFQWCATGALLTLSECRGELHEDPSIEISGVRVRLDQLGDVAKGYCESFGNRPDRRDFETLMVLEGMLVLGRILEMSVEDTSFPDMTVKVTGMLLQEKALPVLEANAGAWGFESLHKALATARSDLSDRFFSYKGRVLRELE